MRNLIFTSVLVLLAISPVFGQDKKEEFFLRGVLRVSQDTPIASKASGGLPENRPLKIFLTTNTDVNVRNSFLGWFKEWNEREGPKYGRVEVVDELSAADIALVRIIDSAVRMADAVVTYDTTTEIDPATRKPVSSPSLPRPTRFAVDVYNYIIIKESGELKSLRRFTDSIDVSSTFRTLTTGGTEDLSRTQQAMMKAINAGTLNSKGRKDAKVAGDKLRDEFFKLLRKRPASK